MSELEKYIDSKVNSALSDKRIPFEHIPKSLKDFWTEHFEKLKKEKPKH